jgi:hypothetical protein
MRRIARKGFLATVGATLAGGPMSRALAANEDDALFMQIANAAAERYVRCPPYISYRVAGTIHAFNGDDTFERIQTVRTVDQMAVVRDAAATKDDLREPFPAPPNFDALSHWTLDMNFNESGVQGGSSTRSVDARFSNVSPMRYRTDIDARADAIVNTVKGYRLTRVADAPEGTGHLVLRRVDAKKHDASLRDVYFDSSSLLPTLVRYDGKDDFRLDVDYAIVDGIWLVRTLRFGYTAYTLGHLIHRSFACEAAYDKYAFSQSSPDARL